jgi:hypothetical protein
MSLFAGAVLTTVALVVGTQAFPQTLKLVSPLMPIPFAVDSAYFEYGPDGSSTVNWYTTSYLHNTKEIILSSSIPDNPVKSVIRRTVDATTFFFYALTLPFRSGSEQANRAAAADLVSKGCLAGPAVGHETILSYPTVVIKHDLPGDSRRITAWLAPDLGCFPLKHTIEEKRPDGTFRLVSGRHALKVTLNP